MSQARTSQDPAPRHQPHVILLFGASGDLARRKLLPGLFHLFNAEMLPDCKVIGISLEELDDEGFRSLALEACESFPRCKVTELDWKRIADGLHYVPLNRGPRALANVVDHCERQLGEGVRRLHYVSTPPSEVPSVLEILRNAGLIERSRIIMEKPFGTDLASARYLNASMHNLFSEEQVYRIDHFLGKEAALNILALRFANGLFEPIWNRVHIDHVQIDVPETLDVARR